MKLADINEANDNTATNVVAPAAEAGMSMSKYIDELIASLKTDYEGLPQGVKNLFIYSKQGNNIALHHLGGCYIQGTFFPADHKIARRLRDEAAMQGNEVARRQQDPKSSTWGLPVIINYAEDAEKNAWPASFQSGREKNLQQDPKQAASGALAVRAA